MLFILFGIPFFLCLLISVISGRWGIRFQVLFFIYIGIMGGALFFENMLLDFIGGFYRRTSPFNFPLLILIMAVSMYFTGRKLSKSCLRVKALKTATLISSIAVTGFILTLIFILLYGTLPWVTTLFNEGANQSSRYLRGGGSVLFLHLIIGILVPLFVLIILIFTIKDRKILINKVAQRLTASTPPRPHPIVFIIIIILFFLLMEIFL